jgi:proline iminopeptidase
VREKLRRSRDVRAATGDQTRGMRLSLNATEVFFDVEGARLVAEGVGLQDRPTLVVLHGGPGFDHAYFKPFLSELSDTCQLVYVDLRGQGRSGRPPVETCTLEQMADDIASLCDALAIERPIVLGHSAGGFVALTLAVRHPQLAAGFILVDTAAATAAMSDSMSRLEQRCGAEARAAAERMFSGDFSEPAMDDFLRLVFPAYLADQSKMPIVGPAVGRSAFNPEVAAFYFSQRAPLYDVRDKLPGIGQPSLVVVGDRDWLTPPAASEDIVHRLPNAELRVLPNAGHFAFIEQPKLFADAVRQFARAPASVAVGTV